MGEYRIKDAPYGATIPSGSFYAAPVARVSTSSSLTQDRMYCVPIYLNTACTIAGIGYEQTAAGTTNCVVRLGAHYHDSATGLPGALNFDAGTVAADGANGFKEITGLTEVIPAGLSWLTFSHQVAAASTVRAALDPQAPISTDTGLNAAQQGTAVWNGSVTGAFTDFNQGSYSASLSGPRIVIEAA